MSGTTKQSRRKPSETPALRVLFLDDDSDRAELFLAANPAAVWVETVADCLQRLEEPWHEVHLDHDLGGERFVSIDRDDCGMEVVRWLCLVPRPHLKATRFFVHSHNLAAAAAMALQLQVAGYGVESRPFGCPAACAPPLPPRRSWLDRLRVLVRRQRDG